MELPPSHSVCWRRLAEGGLMRLHTDQLAIQMMTKRLERSGYPVSRRAEEIYCFFQKWQRGLADEIAQLASI